MEIRLRGTPEQVEATRTALARVLRIDRTSRPYADRGADTVRVFLDAVPKDQTR